MSSRPRRAIVGLAVAVAALVGLPASAFAAGEGLTVTPTNTQAGGGTNVSATLTFAPGDTPKTVVTSLAPGMLGNLNANPSCLAATQLTPACQIGTASVSTTGGPVPGTLYLVPAAPSSGDAAGIDLVTVSSPTPQYIGVSLNPSAPGGLNLTTTFPNPAPARITSFTANFTTLNGQEFTRLPSSCSAATSTMSATYYNGTAAGSASSAFAPTGCSSLTYAPTLTAAITRDAKDSGAALKLSIDQAATDSASKTIVLQFPKGLNPNLLPDAPCLTSAPCNVGSATATSPLVPSAALANGTVTLGGTISAPTISIAFPAPFAITLTGAVNLTTGAVTFSNVPDVPLTALNVTITGPNGQKAFTTDCAPASVGGAFTAQSGATKSVSAAIAFTGCAVKPTVSGSTSGLAGGHPKLKFKVTHGKSAPKLATLAVGLPTGLKFARSAIVSHQTCTGTGKKKKCSTTTVIKGLGIAGGRAKSVAIKGGKLVIALRTPANSVSLTISGALISESNSLQTSVKKHKTKTLKFTVKTTDAKRTATTLSLKLRAH
ncbi:MAG: hypothetical protein JO027_20790 [Solirubrobacterales bacterium]|nr:hypothetical protein [Solirubrobacterales bacterium]